MRKERSPEEQSMIDALSEDLCDFCEYPNRGQYHTPTGMHYCEGSQCDKALERWREEHRQSED